MWSAKVDPEESLMSVILFQYTFFYFGNVDCSVSVICG